MPRYVQHISGQGEKFELLDYLPGDAVLNNSDWRVKGFHFLPKSEYRLIEPPAQWRDVTDEIQWSDPDNKSVNDAGTLFILEKNRSKVICRPANGYRLRKVPLWDIGNMPDGFIISVDYPPKVVAETTTTRKQWAFLVERRIP